MGLFLLYGNNFGQMPFCSNDHIIGFFGITGGNRHRRSAQSLVCTRTTPNEAWFQKK